MSQSTSYQKNTILNCDKYLNSPLQVDINSDQAQYEWRKNKKSIGNGAFKYICGTITKKGNPCYNNPKYNGKCYIHCEH
jgi:hypothetical protein